MSTKQIENVTVTVPAGRRHDEDAVDALLELMRWLEDACAGRVEPTETPLGIPAHVVTIEWLKSKRVCGEACRWFRSHSTNGERVITRAFLSEVGEEDCRWVEWLYRRLLGVGLWCYRDKRLTPRLADEYHWLTCDLSDAIDYMMICLYGDIDPFGEEELLDA